MREEQTNTITADDFEAFRKPAALILTAVGAVGTVASVSATVFGRMSLAVLALGIVLIIWERLSK